MKTHLVVAAVLLAAPAGSADPPPPPKTSPADDPGEYLKLLGDPAPAVREQAAATIARRGWASPAVVKALEDALADPDADVRAAVAVALKAARPQRTKADLLRLAGDAAAPAAARAASVRELAARHLPDLAPADVDGLLPDPAVRAEVAALLKALARRPAGQAGPGSAPTTAPRSNLLGVVENAQRLRRAEAERVEGLYKMGAASWDEYAAAKFPDAAPLVQAARSLDVQRMGAGSVDDARRVVAAVAGLPAEEVRRLAEALPPEHVGKLVASLGRSVEGGTDFYLRVLAASLCRKVGPAGVAEVERLARSADPKVHLVARSVLPAVAGETPAPGPQPVPGPQPAAPPQPVGTPAPAVVAKAAPPAKTGDAKSDDAAKADAIRRATIAALKRDRDDLAAKADALEAEAKGFDDEARGWLERQKEVQSIVDKSSYGGNAVGAARNAQKARQDARQVKGRLQEIQNRLTSMGAK